MTATWFILALLVLNLGACVSFLAQADYPWAIIYLGASLIQAGCWWLTK